MTGHGRFLAVGVHFYHLQRRLGQDATEPVYGSHDKRRLNEVAGLDRVIDARVAKAAEVRPPAIRPEAAPASAALTAPAVAPGREAQARNRLDGAIDAGG